MTKTKLTAGEMTARNERIIAAHSAGDSNKTIGEREQLHHGNVAKVIARWRADRDRELAANPPDVEAIVENQHQAAGAKRAARLGPSRRKVEKAKRQQRSAKAKRKRGRSVNGLSLIEAAVKVLQDNNNTPMHCKTLVEQSVKRGYWKPLKGKTPMATLWSRILGDIKSNGRKARFKKAGRGLFSLRAK